MSCEFDNVLNFRDVGKTVNDYLGRRILKEGVLYRSARPDDASLEDRRRIKDDFGIKTVIDLRTKTEHAKQAEKRQADLAHPAALESNPALTEPVRIPGLQYLEMKITGKQFENHLLSQLSWSSYLWVIYLYLSGYRMEAIAVIGKEVMLPRGLVGLGLDTMDQSGPEIAETLRTLVQPESLPVLVHCTQGKDRTGLIIALILMMLEVPTDAITHDYRLSDEGLEDEKEARLAEIRQLGLTDEWGGTPHDFIDEVQRHVNETYGGLDSYLDGVNFDVTERAAVRKCLDVHKP